VRELVRLFHRPEINTGGAQLIFTTHDTSLRTTPDLFRRDQVWFVEKDRDQASALVSLSEFSPRKNEALERGYLMDRYGGTPFLAERLAARFSAHTDPEPFTAIVELVRQVCPVLQLCSLGRSATAGS